MKMLGVTARVCDHKGCTCNDATSKGRTAAKRTMRRREAREVAKDIRLNY